VGAAAVLDALGHPTRRAILEELAAGPLPVGVLAGPRTDDLHRLDVADHGARP